MSKIGMSSDKSFYLDFERPIVELERRIEEVQSQAEVDGLDLTRELKSLEEKVEKLRLEIYSNLSRWQRVQISRHPHRPYTLDYIERMLGEPIMVIGIQNGRNVEERKRRNFGMPHPEGYRKAFRLMMMAAKFKRPLLILVDTSGAYPGIEAEERGQAEAIARNLYEMSHLPVPIVVAIIGQAFSGGAIGMTVGDRILMLEHGCYSVIVPESCSTILFKTRDRKEEAAEALKLSAVDLEEHGIVDRVVPEPFGGAHRDYGEVAENLKHQVLEALSEIRTQSPEELVRNRIDKFSALGVWEEE